MKVIGISKIVRMNVAVAFKMAENLTVEICLIS